MRLPLLAVIGAASSASAQTIGNGVMRFHVSDAVLSPGQSTLVSVTATFDPPGSSLMWPTATGTTVGTVVGFFSAVFKVLGSGSGAGAWGNLLLGPGLIAPPFGHPGVIAGMNVNNINAGVGFGTPIATQPVTLWNGTFTAASPGTVSLSTLFVAVASPPNGPYQGLEIFVDIGPIGIPIYIQTANAAAAITIVPAPASAMVLGTGLCWAARRRRIEEDHR